VAIVVRGKTECRLCGNIHEAGDDLVLFPPGLFSATEAAFEVNDAGVHRDCLGATPYGAEAVAKLKWYVDQVKGKR
jgi:hypothetical protein